MEEYINLARMQGAKYVIPKLVVKIVSLVKNPAVQDSREILFKSVNGGIINISNHQSVFLKSANRMSFMAPVLVADRVDQQGDIISPSVIKEAADLFMSEHRNIDVDHDLNVRKDIKITESWTLKKDETFETVKGEFVSYTKGTWMMEVQANEEMCKRINEGTITGYSIYGSGERIMVKEDKVAKETTETTEIDEKVVDEVKKESQEFNYKEAYESLKKANDELLKEVESLNSVVKELFNEVNGVKKAYETVQKYADNIEKQNVAYVNFRKKATARAELIKGQELPAQKIKGKKVYKSLDEMATAGEFNMEE